MRQRSDITAGCVTAILVIVGWRAGSRLAARYRELERSGVLARRVAGKRAARIERALAAAGATSPLAPVVGQSSSARASLMTAAIQRVEEERSEADVSPRSVALPSSFSSRAPAGAVVLAATGVGLTLPALVRPLADAAPWLALAGAVLVVAAWLVGHRR